jgi:hypothetical protein
VDQSEVERDLRARFLKTDLNAEQQDTGKKFSEILGRVHSRDSGANIIVGTKPSASDQSTDQVDFLRM